MVGAPAGAEPPPAKRVPFYPIQAAVVVAAVVGSLGAIVAVIRRLRRR